jgi:hypothetical protein
MTGLESIMAILVAFVRLFLFALVIWLIVREIRKSGRTEKEDHEHGD